MANSIETETGKMLGLLQSLKRLLKNFKEKPLQHHKNVKPKDLDDQAQRLRRENSQGKIPPEGKTLLDDLLGVGGDSPTKGLIVEAEEVYEPNNVKNLALEEVLARAREKDIKPETQTQEVLDDYADRLKTDADTLREQIEKGAIEETELPGFLDKRGDELKATADEIREASPERQLDILIEATRELVVLDMPELKGLIDVDYLREVLQQDIFKALVEQGAQPELIIRYAKTYGYLPRDFTYLGEDHYLYESKRVSEFQLNEDELRELYSGREGIISLVERNIRAIEVREDTDSRDQRAPMNRLGIIDSHLSQRNFAIEANLTQAEVNKVREQVHDMKHGRIGAHDFRLAIQKGDFRAIVPLAAELGSGGWFRSLHRNGADRAFYLYGQMFEQVRLNPLPQPPAGLAAQQKAHWFGNELGKLVGDKCESVPRVIELTSGDDKKFKSIIAGKTKLSELDDSQLQSLRDLLDGKTLNKRVMPAEINKKLRSKVHEQMKREKKLLGLEDEDIEAGLRTGYNLFVTSQRQAVHTARGAGPVDFTEYRQFMSDPDEYLVSLYRTLEFNIEKWALVIKAKAPILKEILAFAGDGDLEVARRKFSEVLNMYDLFSSRWRADPIYKQLDKLYGSDISKTIALGVRLRDEGGAWLDDSNNTAKKDKVVGVWNTIARYRPQEIAKALMNDGDNDRGVIKFIRNLPRAEGQPRFENYTQLEQYLGTHYYTINGMLEKAYLPAIDYAAGPTAEQQAVISNVFEVIDGNKEEYLSIMNTLTQVGSLRVDGGQSTINTLVENPLYRSLYYRTLFLDDARFDQLENSDRFTQDEARISEEYYLGKGTGRRDMFARGWGDTETGSTALQSLIGAALSEEKEKLVTDLREAFAGIKIFAGEENARFAVTNIAGGWGKVAKADGLKTALGLDALPIRSSRFQRAMGLKAPSLNPDEEFELQNDIELFVGRLRGVDPELSRRLEKALGTELWRIMSFRSRGILLIALLVMIKGMFEDIQKLET